VKKILSFILILFLFILFFPSCKGGFNVDPRELSITMTDEFIKGNTLKKILVFNDQNENINISWYLDNPEPLSSIRPNRTAIPELSWIDLEPKWQIILPKGNAAFFIYLDIPKNKFNQDQNWEVWITFKLEEKQFINIEHAVRLYIDTPEKSNDIISGATTEEKTPIMLNELLLLIIILSILVIVIILFRKNKSK